MNNQVGIQLHDKQIEARKNGASAFILMIDEDIQLIDDGIVHFIAEANEDNWTTSLSTADFIEAYSPLQKGDTFTYEEWIEEYGGMDYSGSNPIIHKGTIESVEVKRVQELTTDELRGVGYMGYFLGQHKLKYINSIFGSGTYERNPYIFINYIGGE